MNIDIKYPVFVSSVPKSGTWLLREILHEMTGLQAHEPDIGSSAPNYEDEKLIEFPVDTFFSWHSILTQKTALVLKNDQTRNIFLIRNVYDVLLSMYNHLSRDVDAAIGRSIVGSDYFEGKSFEQCMTLMIAGFTSSHLTWMGASQLIKQIDSILAYVESEQGLLIDYEQLTTKKHHTIKEIQNYLGLHLSGYHIKNILNKTDKDVMRERLKKEGSDAHVTLSHHALSRDIYMPYHKEMLDRVILSHAPKLASRLDAIGKQSILYLEEQPVKKIKRLKEIFNNTFR
jgi:Sulfotransferase domain